MLRDPSHYLKPLTSTSTPKRLLWLACRGYTARKRDHYEQHFLAAALGKTWWTTASKAQREDMAAYDDPAALWDAVAAWCPVGRRSVLFAYDLAEQMRLSQLLTHLPLMGWSLDKIVLERTASWCLLRSGKRSLMCCDLRSWAPVGWEKILSCVAGGDHGLGPMPDRPATAAARCLRNASVIRAAVLQILEWIESEQLGQFRPTGSGQSFTAYRRRFLQGRILVHDDLARLTAEREAMHTGRAEAWRVGTLRDGPYVEYDLHAAYATIGRDCELPVRARGEIRSPTASRVARAMDRYAVLANITVSSRVECLPYRIDQRTLWPVGRFTTTVWSPELRLALDYCDTVRINHVWLYSTAPCLRDFCSWVLDGMEDTSGRVSPMARRVLKHWSRCLVGRLGLRYRSWVRFGPHDPPDVRLVTYSDLEDGTSTDMLFAGTHRLLLSGMTESRESLPQVPGWIMSQCRAALWHQIAVTGDAMVYCDTDSIILKTQGDTAEWHPYEYAGAQLRWDRKGVHSRLTIHGPRNLHVGSDRRVTGIPLTARQSAPLEFEGEVMRSVKHSMRNGEIDRVVTLPRTFHLTSPDLRRQHNPDGSTSPFEVDESQSQEVSECLS